jgi:hypothetical protein
MAIKPIIIKSKSSGTPGNAPSALQPGELAINYADGKLYYLNQSGGQSYIQNSNSFSTIIANGTPLFATTPNSILAVNPDTSNTIQFTANTQTDTITLGVNENNIVSFVRKSGDTMIGDLHVDTANVYTNHLIANTINFVDANGSGNLYVAGVITGPTIQAIDDYANASFAHANAAYEFANSAVMEVAVTDENYSSNNSSNTFFISFTDKTNATVNSVFTNVDVLTYVPSTGTLSSNTISANTVSVSNISSIAAGTVNLVNLYPSIVDKLDIYSFRSSSYHFQIENGLDSHMINMNVLNGDTLATFTVYGETFTYDSLGTFSANVESGMVNVLFTPNYAPMTVSFMRRSLQRLGIEYPPVDVGTVINPSTITLDLGYVFLTADHIVDYGNLSDQMSNSGPSYDAQVISGSMDSGTF